MLSFSPQTKLSGHGRLGILTTPHGIIRTPVFMPVGTQASVKSLSPEDLNQLGAQIILANNYHLYLRPKSENIKKMGGIHNFMGWHKPILTDSGGFQVQSLGREDVALCKISDQGVVFRSHLDGGSLHNFTPEVATKSQIDIGADIIMAFDDSTPADANYQRSLKALERTHDWLKRCISTYHKSFQHRKPKSFLFGIIQGGGFADLRRQSAEFIVSQDLPGIAIGGASIGRNAQETAENINFIRDLLPKDKPLYAMGVGTKPSDIKAIIEAGADMFDCVAPTRLARCGQLYHPDVKNEYIDISQSKFLLDKKPLAPECDCYTCQSGFSKGYLHHLFKSKELLYFRLASIHNLRTMIATVDQICKKGQE